VWTLAPNPQSGVEPPIDLENHVGAEGDGGRTLLKVFHAGPASYNSSIVNVSEEENVGNWLQDVRPRTSKTPAFAVANFTQVGGMPT